jgi:hypothetical protein
MRKLFVSAVAASLFALGSMNAVDAEPRSSVIPTSANHTKIVIHDDSPQASEARNEQARRARERLDLKAQRAHEIELAKIRAGQSGVASQPQVASQATQTQSNTFTMPSIEERRKYQAEQNKPAAFMNGGQWTGLTWGGFGSLGWFGPGFGPGFVGPGFGPGFIGPGFVGPGACGPVPYRGGYRGGYRGAYRGGGFRGRGCR